MAKFRITVKERCLYGGPVIEPGGTERESNERLLFGNAPPGSTTTKTTIKNGAKIITIRRLRVFDCILLKKNGFYPSTKDWYL